MQTFFSHANVPIVLSIFASVSAISPLVALTPFCHMSGHTHKGVSTFVIFLPISTTQRVRLQDEVKPKPALTPNVIKTITLCVLFTSVACALSEESETTKANSHNQLENRGEKILTRVKLQSSWSRLSLWFFFFYCLFVARRKESIWHDFFV